MKDDGAFLREDTLEENNGCKIVDSIEYLKQKYKSGNYICVFKAIAVNIWLINKSPTWNVESCIYKLIHKIYEDILKAYLDGKDIESRSFEDDWKVCDFINDYDEMLMYRIKETKSSCERKFKVGDIVTGVNQSQLSIYKRAFEIIDYDEILKSYILENALGYKEEDLELYVEKSIAEKRFSVGNFIAVANSKLKNYNKVLRINEINGNDVRLSDGSVVFWTDIEIFQKEEAKSSCEEFMKFDTLKPNLAILFDTGKALEDVANVMSYGAKKYDRKNWSKVDNKERYVSAPLRHIAAYCSGEKIDPESGLPHLACAITSLLFLQEIERNEYGNN